MDKAKTLEVLRGMKFMQRKEEAKRRATFEVAQREEIERHLHGDGTLHHNSSSSVGGASASPAGVPGAKRSGPARATILYDDAFPIAGYGLARRSFTDTLGGLPCVDDSAAPEGSSEQQAEQTALASSSLNAVDRDGHDGQSDEDDDEEVADLWGGSGDDEMDGGTSDPTAAPRRGHGDAGAKRGAKAERHGGRSDGRFTVSAAVRAPKLPRRLEESVAEEARQRKRRRAEEEDEIGY